MAASEMGGKYDEMVDRKSAEEMLNAKREAINKAQVKAQEKALAKAKKTTKKKATSKRKTSGRRKKSAGDHIAYEAKLVARQLVRSQGRKLLRGLLGSMMRR